MRRINWIASYPKSGNTWVRAIVDRIVHPERPFDINALGATAPSFARLTQKFVERNAIEVAGAAPGEVRRWWTPLQREICMGSGHEIFLKTHNVAAKFDSGPFPDPGSSARAIYVLRDPRDVALSYAHHYKMTPGLAVVALCTSSAFNIKQEQLGLTELLMSWGEHVFGWTSLKSCPLLVLRYEDLLADPAAGVRQIAKFLDKPLASDQVEEIVAATSFRELQGQEKAKGFNESVRADGFFRAGTAGQWRDIEDQSVFQPLIDKHARMMRKHGYL
ncbi:MAG: sulfotransferase domain-containing protein [Geminicoccaceae bacterium]